MYSWHLNGNVQLGYWQKQLQLIHFLVRKLAGFPPDMMNTSITAVGPYPGGIRSKTPGGSLKPRIVPNPIFTVFFYAHNL